MNRICHIEIDERGLARPTPEIEQERRVAIFDLLEDNSFALPPRDDRAVPPGPYRVGLAIRDGRLVFDIADRGRREGGRVPPLARPLPAGREGLLPDLRNLLRRRQAPAPQPDRGDRHGAARHPQRRRARSCRNGWKARPRSTSTPRAACSP